MARTVFIALSLSLLTGLAFGRQAPSAPAPTAPGSTGVDVPIRRRAATTPAEMVAEARRYRDQMESVSAQVKLMVDQARGQKDVIRLNCILDRSAQVQANLTIADSALRSLGEAAARNDDGASAHEFSRISIVNQKIQVLAGEVQACAGEDLSYVGTTRVDVDVSGVPPDNFTDPSASPPAVDRPPTASPYM
jgi:hypothetical protein